jgi:hypothetical protein
MDGKNFLGRRISLLNDNLEPPHQPVRLFSMPFLCSGTSSYTSSQVDSSLPPQLVRSDSPDSTTIQTSSPRTPGFAFEGPPPQAIDSPIFCQPSFFPQQKGPNPAYPPVPQPSGPLPYYPTVAQAAYFRPQQMPEQRPASTAAALGDPRPKKNRYLCPMAKQFNCNDYFTTTGHATRHAKKHTGKKDAFCPECNKAFTRKDNMEQHRRTHRSDRNAAKGGDSNVKKAKQQVKRPKPAPLQSSMPLLSSLFMVNSSLRISPERPSFIVPAVQPTGLFDFSRRSPHLDPTASSMSHSYSVDLSHGLDALANVANGEKRKFEA